jgi:crossover junction endodeoxyribonuclease RuvC
MFEGPVLGVDPGLARTGLAVLEVLDRKPVITWSDTVFTPAGTPEAGRLRTIAAALRTAIQTHRPVAVAVERVMFGVNKGSALSVARATGVVMLVAAEAGLEVEEYVPLEVKSAVTGQGSADKRQVHTALIRVHGLADVPSQPDAADAVAVALCHLTQARLRMVATRAGIR